MKNEKDFNEIAQGTAKPAFVLLDFDEVEGSSIIGSEVSMDSSVTSSALYDSTQVAFLVTEDLKLKSELIKGRQTDIGMYIQNTGNSIMKKHLKFNFDKAGSSEFVVGSCSILDYDVPIQKLYKLVFSFSIDVVGIHKAIFNLYDDAFKKNVGKPIIFELNVINVGKSAPGSEVKITNLNKVVLLDTQKEDALLCLGHVRDFFKELNEVSDNAILAALVLKKFDIDEAVKALTD